MAKKKKKQESLDEFIKNVHNGKGDQYHEGLFVGDAKTGTRTSVSEVNALRKAAQQKAAEEYQNELNNRTTLQWLNARDKSEEELKVAQNRLLTSMQDKGINAKIEGTKAIATPYKMEDLEVGVPKTFNKNNLNKELDNKIAFLDYTKSGEYRTLQRDVANKWDERAFNQSNLERKMAEEDLQNAGLLKRTGLGILAGFSDIGSALRGDLTTSSGVRYASYGETLESELPDKASTPVGQFALKVLPQFTKLWGASAFGTAGQVMYFLDGVNDAYNSAKTRGYTEDASRLYGTLVGSLDTIWNLFLGSKATKMGNETPGVFEKMFGSLFGKIFKNNAAKEMATTLFSEGSEELSQEYVEKFLDHTILDVYDRGENFDVKAFINSDTFKDSLESFLIGAAIGGGMKSYQNIMTPKDVKNVNQAIYTIERSNGRELSNYNKALINNITAEYENKLQKVPNAQTIINTYNNLKSLEVDNFRNNAVNLYTNLDDNSRVQYNNLIDDVSELIYNTGIPIRFDSKLDTISEWDNNTLVVNPALTDTPMKTLLLKELGTKLVDNSTKKYILSYMKKNGLYDTLKSELLASGEFDEANVDNEIVSRELNSIFEDQNKLEQLAKNNEGAFKGIKSVIDNLASTVGNRQTKDAVFLKVLGDRFNVIDLSKNNVNISELKVDKNKKSTVVNNVLNVDTNQYKGVGKKSVENIVNSNLLDNSITAKELVHFIGKISEDTGREIKLVDNKDLKDLGLKVKDAKGKVLSIEGFTKDGVIRVNMNAQNPLNVVIGHELTDSLRGSKYYDGLVKAVNNFISEKEKNTRLENLNKLYANVENAKINDELVSDVVGEYLFTNKDFLEKLTEDRGLFNRLFDEVRYLWRQFRGKNTALDKLMHNFTKVYNDKVAVKSDFNYSLQEKKSGKAYGLDNEGTKLTQDQLNYFEDAATYDVNGALIRWYHTTTSKMKPFTIFNPVGTPGYKFGNQVVIFTTDDKTMSGSYANSDLDYMVYRSRKLQNMEDANAFLDGIAKIYKTKFKIEDNTKYENGKIEVINKGTEGHNIAEKMFNEYFVNGSDTETDAFEYFNNLLESSTVWNDKGNAEVIDLDHLKHNVDFVKNTADTDYKKERASIVEKMYNNVHDYLSKITDVYEMADEFSVIYDTLLGMYSTPFNYEYQYDSEEEMLKKLIKDIGYTGQHNIQYELYANVKNPLVVDLKGRSWTRDWNKELYNKYKDREWFKKNKTDKRALEFLDRFTGDNADDVKLQHKLHKLVEKSFDLYSDNYNKSKNAEFLNKYTMSHTNLTFNDMAILDTVSNVYKNYKEFYNDYGENYGFPKPSETINTSNARNIFGKNETTAEEYFNKYMEAESAYQNYGKRDTYFINEIRKSLALEDDDLIYQALNDATDYQLSQLWSFDMTYDYDIDDAFSLWLTDNRREYGYQTNDIIRDVLESNAKGETNYDGVIIKNVVDYGHLLPNQDHTPNNLCIAFSPEQVKSIYNQHPTSDPDIDYKLSQIASEEKGDYNVYGKDIKANPLVKGIKKAESKQEKKKAEAKKVVKPEEVKSSMLDYLPTQTINKSQDALEKERQAYQSVIDSPSQTKEAKELAQELIGVDTYVPDSNKSELDRADKHIEKYGADSALNMLRQATENARNNVDDIAVGNRLIEYYQKIGDKDRASEALQLTAMAGTNVGRATQAMSLLSRMTPIGQATYIQRIVNKYNKQMEEAYNKSKNPLKKLQQFEFTTEMKDLILNSNKENLEKNVDEVYKQLGQQVEMSTLEKLDTWRYFSMLSAATTHIRNIIGNIAMGGMQRVKNKLKGGIEDIYYGVSGKEGERTSTAKIIPKEYKQFAKNDLQNVQKQLGIGDNKYTNPKSKLQENMRMFSNQHKIFPALNKVGDLLEKFVKHGVIDLTSKALAKEDVWGLKSEYKKALSEYLYANNININKMSDSELSRARNYAIEQAKEATFHQYSALASLLNTYENKNLATKLIIGGIVPFKQTPFNIAKTAVAYNPVGLLKTLSYDSVRLYNGQITANQYIDNISKGLTGTGIALLGFALASMGKIVPSGDDDDKFDEDRGIQPYSLVIGDKTITFDWLSPTAVPLFVGAELYNNMYQDDNLSEEEKTTAFKSAVNVLNASVSSLNPVSEMTMLSGIQSALQTYSGDYSTAAQEIGTNTIKSYVNQLVPSILGKVAKSTDEYERSTSTTGKTTVEKAIESVINQTKSKIPGLRQTLPKKTDVWGNEIKQNDNPLLRTVYNLSSPATIKTIRTTELDKEIDSIYQKTNDSSVLPKTYISKDVNIGDKKYRLTEQEYAMYKQIFGKQNYKKLNELIKTDAYKSLSNEQKADVISKIYSYDRDAIKQAYAKQHNISYEDKSYLTEKKIESLGGNVGDYYSYKATLSDKDDAYEKREKLKDSKISDTSKSAIYEASATKGTLDLYKVLKESNVDINAYLDYLSKEFKADYKSNGNVIMGSRKSKVYDYMNSTSGLTLEQKMLILGKEFALSNSEKNYVVQRIAASDLSVDEKLELCKSISWITVSSDGTVRW